MKLSFDFFVYFYYTIKKENFYKKGLNMKKIVLERDVEHILTILRENGSGYIVGGYVRDKLLGIPPKDCDFCTNLSYETLLEIFKDYNAVAVGKSFGVVKIYYNNKEYDIAKMRKDISFTTDRKNTKIEFINDIQEDLNRRDFTINAIAYDGENLIPVNSHALSDIEDRIIRFIGNPADRIKEDPLRIMRGIRLFVQKNFNHIENITFNAIKNNASLIGNLSYERIRDEFIKIIMSSNPKLGMIYLLKSNLLNYFLPEIYQCYNFMQNNPHHSKDVFGHTLLVLKNTHPDLVLRLSALFHDVGKPLCYTETNGIGHFYSHDKIGYEITKIALKRLHFDNTTIETVSLLVKYHMSFHTVVTSKFAKKIINEIGIDNLDNLYQLCRADILGSFPPYNFSRLDESINIIREILNRKEPISVKDLAISGKDIIQLGFPAGIKIGEILNFLLNHILEYPEENKKDILLKMILNNFR